MSRPESVSSSTQSRGCNSAICRISLRFFSPPEKPTLTPRRSISCSMPSLPATSRTRLRNSGVEISSSPRFLRCALSAVQRNVMVATPGISNGYWKARKRPRAARSSAGSARMSSPSSRTSPCVTTYSSLPASTCASVDLPEPFGPMRACTLPRLTESSSPLRIFLPSTSTCRFFTSSRCIRSYLDPRPEEPPKAASRKTRAPGVHGRRHPSRRPLHGLLRMRVCVTSSVFAGVIVGGHQAAEAGIACGLEVGVLHARGDGDLVGVGVVDDIDPAHGRNAEITELLGTGIDELMRLRAGRRGHDVAAANRDGRVAEAVFTLARHDEEQLVRHVMAVEGERLFAGRHDVHRAAQAIEPDQRADAAPFDRELLAVAAVDQRHVVDIDHGFFGHPTLPSRLIEISFCASTANSMGSCWSTSLTKPLTTSATASSADKPRWRQ